MPRTFISIYGIIDVRIKLSQQICGHIWQCLLFWRPRELQQKGKALHTTYIQVLSGEKNFMTCPFESLNKLCFFSATWVLWMDEKE